MNLFYRCSDRFHLHTSYSRLHICHFCDNCYFPAQKSPGIENFILWFLGYDHQSVAESAQNKIYRFRIGILVYFGSDVPEGESIHEINKVKYKMLYHQSP